MFTSIKTFNRVVQATVIAVALAVVGLSSAAHAGGAIRGGASTPSFDPNSSFADDQLAAQKNNARLKARHSVNSAKSAKSLQKARESAELAKKAKAASRANNIRKGAKVAKTAGSIAKAAAAGTGVGAVVGITAELAGVDPIELATLKATDPAEYNRRMKALKKNPVKYMGNNIKNNTKKAAQNVGKATKTAAKAVGTAGKKVGCGVGNLFKKKDNKKSC
jgi:hypothetical protein